MEPFACSYEKIGNGVEVCVTGAHTFGTDSFLLADFSSPKPRDTVCDLCSGCGIIPLLLLREEKRPQKAWAVDIQPQAVEQMELSRSRSGLREQFLPIQADLRELKGKIPFDSMRLVTCNPPYKGVGAGLMSESVADKIARHETMCTLDDVCAAAAKLLQFGGRLCLSQLPERLPDVLESMRRFKLEPKRLRFVQQRPDSAPWLVLAEGRLGSGRFLKVDPPLILRDEGGNPSAEMMRIYGMYGRA